MKRLIMALGLSLLTLTQAQAETSRVQKILDSGVLFALRSTALLLGPYNSEGQYFSKKEEVNALSLKAVIGRDNRRESRWTNTLDKKLQRRVGVIHSVYKDNNGNIKKKTCTATVIGKNLAVTAANCVLNPDFYNQPIENAYFYPGAFEKNLTPYHRFPIIKSFLPITYKESGYGVNDSYDIAVIQLGKGHNGKEVGQVVGASSYWGNRNFETEEVLTIGYPRSKGEQTQYFEKKCSAERYGEKSFKTDCDITKGQTGSPIFAYSKKHNLHYIAGVISSENEYENSGSLITPERHKAFEAIKDWTYDPKDFDEKWTINYHKHYGDNSLKVFMRNKCKKDVAALIHYRNTDGKWATKGVFVIKKDQTVLMGYSSEEYFYLSWTLNKGRTFGSRYDRSFDNPTGGGKNLPFQRFDVKRTGDFVKEINNCR